MSQWTSNFHCASQEKSRRPTRFMLSSFDHGGDECIQYIVPDYIRDAIHENVTNTGGLYFPAGRAERKKPEPNAILRNKKNKAPGSKDTSSGRGQLLSYFILPPREPLRFRRKRSEERDELGGKTTIDVVEKPTDMGEKPADGAVDANICGRETKIISFQADVCGWGNQHIRRRNQHIWQKKVNGLGEVTG